MKASPEPAHARGWKPSPKPANVLLKVMNPSLRRPVVELLDCLGCWFVEGSEPGDEGESNASDDTVSAQVDLVLIVVDGDHPWPADRSGKSQQTAAPPPPTVVFGPNGEGDWRRLALEAGAFACLSLGAPLEERSGLLAAAARYRAAQREIQLLRTESERICASLLRSFSHEAEKLRKTIREVQKVQESLQEMQVRILKSIS